MQQKAALEQALNQEKASGQAKISDLERRLRELTDCVMNKMTECNGARDIQMSLKAEINSYKSLLETEDNRYVPWHN